MLLSTASAGGEKSVVSLALLLALQRVAAVDSAEAGSSGEDSRGENVETRRKQGGAPGLGTGVLLLDEADAALDEAFRRRLADALRESVQTSHCQVVVSTFRQVMAGLLPPFL